MGVETEQREDEDECVRCRTRVGELKAGHVSRVCGLDAIRSYSGRIQNVMKRIRS